MDAQMKKGVLELCLLQCLSGEPKYGYDVTESTFYAVLRRLHKEGAAETFQGSASNGPVRKYYRLTDQGREQLEQLAEDWRRLREITEALGIGR